MGVAGTVALALAALLGPAASADTRSDFCTTSPPAGGSRRPAGRQPPSPPARDSPGPTGRADGGAAAGDAGLTQKELKPTAQPLTAYEMPFPCGEVWGGSTRSGHSPSVRAVDFNFSGGDLGKPAVAAAPGTVVTAVVGKKKPSYGQYVVIDHGNGESSLYAHLDSVAVVVGQVVGAGTQIGTVGSTGNASGSHLHFEERLGGAVVDAWFHGARFPMNSSQASQNCGQVAVSDIPLAGRHVRRPVGRGDGLPSRQAGGVPRHPHRGQGARDQDR